MPAGNSKVQPEYVLFFCWLVPAYCAIAGACLSFLGIGWHHDSPNLFLLRAPPEVALVVCEMHDFKGKGGVTPGFAGS